MVHSHPGDANEDGAVHVGDLGILGANYKQPGDNGPYDLSSLGADGEVGGEGDDADIVNW